MEGWIMLHRNISEHWIFENPKYLKWWLTILLKVNYTKTKFYVGSEIYSCNPGQSFRSYDTWASLFKCSKRTAIRFFTMLEKDNMIRLQILGKGNQRKTLVTVMEWQNFNKDNEPKSEPKSEPESNRKVNQKVHYIEKGNKEEGNKEKTLNIHYMNISTSFERFWNLYDKKIERKKCFSIWQKLKPEVHETILQHVPKYKQTITDPKYQKHPATYLKNECWNDDYTVKTIFDKTPYQTQGVKLDAKRIFQE